MTRELQAADAAGAAGVGGEMGRVSQRTGAAREARSAAATGRAAGKPAAGVSRRNNLLILRVDLSADPPHEATDA